MKSKLIAITIISIVIASAAYGQSIGGWSSSGIPASYLDTDGTLTANSDTKVASQKATKTYADTMIPKSTFVAAGDLMYGSAAGTPAILSHPAAAYYLLATNAATTFAWLASSADVIDMLGAANDAEILSKIGAVASAAIKTDNTDGITGGACLPIVASDNDIEEATLVGLTITGTTSPTISVTGCVSSDADPATAAGNFKHDSTDTGSSSGGSFKWYDGAQVRTFVDTGTNYTIITKTEYIPIGYAEDGAAAPNTATVWADTRKAKVREFAADADDDVEIHWMAPDDYVGGIKFRAIGFVTNATAPANTETVILNLAGCSVGNSDDGGCTLGTGIDSTFTADATYAQHDRWSTGWSNEITVTNITAGESVMLKLFRDVDDTYEQKIGVAGIEIKYKAKIVGITGY